MKKLKKVGMLLAVSTFVLGGVCLVNADSQAQSWFGSLEKGGSLIFEKVYSYPLHQGGIKPTTSGTSVTWTLSKYSSTTKTYVTKKQQTISNMSLNTTYWTDDKGANIGSGKAKHQFKANDAFYGNLQTLNATES